MSETLFERYREALRAGHVAGLRGHLEEAAAAYREAISLAGDRVVPRAALGRVLLRQGDPAAALEAYDGALALASGDDESLLGRAQALVVLRRTAEAAAAYDQLADARESAGRSADAIEAARRAAAIESTDERRRRLDALAGEPVNDLEYQLVEGPLTKMAAPADLAAAEEEEVAAETIEDGAVAEPAAPEDPEALMIEAEDAVARGDSDAAATAALAAGRAYLAAGQADAAMDACVLGIGARPADTELHLLLVRLGVSRAGEAWAADAQARLLRLAELDGDAAAAERIRAAASSAVARE
jgi:tetratricopeptide (TPR) repeat protein